MLKNNILLFLNVLFYKSGIQEPYGYQILYTFNTKKKCELHQQWTSYNNSDKVR